ncbi:phosphatidylserine decarboxylase [Rhizoctonia solani AG-1 IB]|uniref:Phosphatidylserine decarboxylase n=1 Tax=Thanatephorus cucumeris (strain AG1-IB / isolate 7/3/14) TaxID=1108050 RepID=A0A0B7G2R6_THACB|nr:phosphatidylserine decarboxylase [Rhizoctonia solani AG-1 IB]
MCLKSDAASFHGQPDHEVRFHERGGRNSYIPTSQTVGKQTASGLSRNHQATGSYVSRLLEKVGRDERRIDQLHPTIVEFKTLIDTTPALSRGFTQMFEQIPNGPPYDKDPSLRPQIRDYDTMFKAFDYIITHSIPHEDHAFVGFPINAILNWPMGTEAGQQMFLMPSVNAQFKKMFDAWAKFLSSSASREYLTVEDNGWFGPKASAHIPNFAELFKCDPSSPHYGFKSWDDFFTREFRDGIRPVEFKSRDDIINSACESTVYRIATNIKEVDSFWLKGSPYSLRHMLNDDPYTDQFIGGTIYQAFLSAYMYHRWASPINGIIDRVELIPGAYYATSPAMGFANPDGPDPVAQMLSQAYITAVATRALIWIRCNNPEVGLIGFLAVGMCEVSTCEVTVKKGDMVRKGEQLGPGSDLCLKVLIIIYSSLIMVPTKCTNVCGFYIWFL